MLRRPAFSQEFPRTSELDALVDAFAAGDYARVRKEALRLAETAPEGEVRRAARTLLERTKPDPVAVWLVALTAGLLVIVSVYWMGHSTPPDGARGSGSPTRPQRQ